MQKIAISIGDLNGIGIELALIAHEKINKICKPVYIVDKNMLKKASKLLGLDIPDDFVTINNIAKEFDIHPGEVCEKSGLYSYKSFLKAIWLAKNGEVDSIMTLPVNKEAWNRAGLEYKGHTDMLADIFNKNAIMMLGCEEMFVTLFTHHIPLKDVANKLNKKDLVKFLLDFYKNIDTNKIAVLGLNPHAGDGGSIGSEDYIINEAIQEANKTLNKQIFEGPLVPDIAFSKDVRKKYKYFVAMYHDQGLIPLKALYFEQSINVTLNLPIKRASVDHGTAFDKAYKKANISTFSYVNAFKYLIL